MIDEVKMGDVLIPRQDDLEWRISVKEKTGEIKNVRIAEYNGLIFIEKDGRTYIKGSLHKYNNKGEHNYDQFTYSNLALVINDLESRFGIDPKTTVLENLEFGINIELPFTTDKVLNSLLNHRGEEFRKISKGNGVECIHAQYYIKVYDKALKSKLSINLLRVEIKAIKMAYFAQKYIKIKTLSDLLIKDNLKALQELLIKTMDEVIWTDISLLNDLRIPEKERLILSNGSNYKHWHSLKPDSKNFQNGRNDSQYKKQRCKYNRELKKFKSLICKYDNGFKNDILEMIRHNFTGLLNSCNEHNFTDPTGYQKEHNITDSTVDRNNNKSSYSFQIKETTLPQAYSENLCLPSKHCLVTGLDISMQKPDSKLLGRTGIKFYLSHDLAIFAQLENRLSLKWKDEPEKIRIKEIAHSIENDFYNPRKSYRSRLNRCGQTLFDDSPYMVDRLRISLEYAKMLKRKI